MKKQWTIGQKITGGYGLVLAALAVIAAWSVYGIGGIVRNAKEVISGNRLRGEMVQKEVDHLNWANQVTIYKNQQLIKTGVYKYVRHPLYASLIWMFYGACLVYPNYLALIANTILFVPFMFYRAKQEEKLLMERFEEYGEYKKTTGMLFPKLKLL